MEKFCKDLKEHATKIINFKKKDKMLYSINNRRKQKVCYLCKKEFSTDDDNKKYHKVRDHCQFTGTYSNICNLRYKIPKEIPI